MLSVLFSAAVDWLRRALSLKVGPWWVDVAKWRNFYDCTCSPSTMKKCHSFSFYFIDPWLEVLPLWTPSPYPPPSPLWAANKCKKFNFRKLDFCSHFPIPDLVMRSTNWMFFWGKKVERFDSIMQIIIFTIAHPKFVSVSMEVVVTVLILTIAEL